jgi:hypothetical protein
MNLPSLLERPFKVNVPAAAWYVKRILNTSPDPTSHLATA